MWNRTEEEIKGEKLNEKIFEQVVKKLENKDDWKSSGDCHVHHKTEDICLRYDMDWANITHKLTQPEYLENCPKKYNRKIQMLVRNIIGFNDNQKKLFALAYVSGKFAGYLDWDDFPDKKENGEAFAEWLKHEVTEENYVLKTHSYHSPTYYFKRQEDFAFLVLKWL